MKDFKSKCACSAGGIGICLCIIFMSLAILGTTAVGISKNANMSGMSRADSDSGTSSSMSAMSLVKSSDAKATSNSDKTSESPQHIIVNFFSGVGGQIILLLSFGALFAGIWFSGSNSNKKLVLPISIIGAVILYISMYNFYSAALEVTGSMILALAYASTFSHRVARTVRLAY